MVYSRVNFPESQLSYDGMGAVSRQCWNWPKVIITDKPSNFWYKPHLSKHLTVDHSDVVGASPVGAAPTTSSFFS